MLEKLYKILPQDLNEPIDVICLFTNNKQIHGRVIGLNILTNSGYRVLDGQRDVSQKVIFDIKFLDCEITQNVDFVRALVIKTIVNSHGHAGWLISTILNSIFQRNLFVNSTIIAIEV